MREGTEQIFKLLRTALYWRLQQAVWLVVWPELTEQTYLPVGPLPTQPLRESRLVPLPVLSLSSQERQKRLRISLSLWCSESWQQKQPTTSALFIALESREQFRYRKSRGQGSLCVSFGINVFSLSSWNFKSLNAQLNRRSSSICLLGQEGEAPRKKWATCDFWQQSQSGHSALLHSSSTQQSTKACSACDPHQHQE